MDTQRADILLQEADQMVQDAGAEMNRSEEDAITHTVCFKSRQAIVNYLTVYLLNSNVRPADPPIMAALLDQCRSLDGRFDLLNIANIHCRFEDHDEEYCLNVDQVDYCLKVAEQARGIVKGTTPGY